MMYNPAFDPFNGIYRMLNILRHFGVGEIIEVDRLRIYDFYLLCNYSFTFAPGITKAKVG